ncbi:putative plastid-lipid-associated protein 11 [Citrus sinensis]|nr:putative plastid-lipid-associated protein 11 [Citrus sinensis]
MATSRCFLLLPISLNLPNCNANSSKRQRRVHNHASRNTCSSTTNQSQSAKQELLNLIADQDRGLKTQKDPNKRSSIIKAIDDMAVLGSDMDTTGDSLSATWRLLWTTEKEQLFIIEKAYLFGTQTGDVLQVIDVEKKVLNNVITFPPDGVFFVRSNIEIASPQRVNFRFTSAVLRGKNWEVPLPPFGKGWFETVYLDDEIRVVKDIRGDYLVVERAPYQWTEFRSVYLDDNIRIAKDIYGDYQVCKLYSLLLERIHYLAFYFILHVQIPSAGYSFVDYGFTCGPGLPVKILLSKSNPNPSFQSSNPGRPRILHDSHVMANNGTSGQFRKWVGSAPSDNQQSTLVARWRQLTDSDDADAHQSTSYLF